MQGDLKPWFMDLVHDEKFLKSDLVDNPLKLKNKIVKIVNKKDSSYSNAESCWIELSPFIWGQSILSKNYNIN